MSINSSSVWGESKRIKFDSIIIDGDIVTSRNFIEMSEELTMHHFSEHRRSQFYSLSEEFLSTTELLNLTESKIDKLTLLELHDSYMTEVRGIEIKAIEHLRQRKQEVTLGQNKEIEISMGL